ncbi:hypothetical protein HWV62_37843 [Athelia sp. TMB]|nr:hypothetical protein HWV62_37843 [Athelia sp. TMB]
MSEPAASGSPSDPSTADLHIAGTTQRSPRVSESDVFATAPTAALGNSTATHNASHNPTLRAGQNDSLRQSPVSPTPIRGEIQDLGPRLGDNPPSSVLDSRSRGSGSMSESALYLSSAERADNSGAPIVRFEALEGQLPEDQLHGLRVFAANHSLGIQRLRVAESNLSNLNGQLNDVREHATSLSRRINRAMEDNNRFLLESDAQLADLRRMFDRPRTSPVIVNRQPLIADEPRPLATRSDTASEDGLYEPTPGIPEDSASRALATGSGRASSPAVMAARSTSSRSSLPAQQPNETTDQYDARYAANIRRIDRTEESWSRPYATQDTTATRASTANVPAHTPHTGASRDVRFERAPAPREPIQRDPYAFIPRSNPDSASRAPANNPLSSGTLAPPQGISAYRVTHGAVTNGLWNNDHYHYVVLLGKITQLIHHKVGTTIDVPTGFKQPKLAEPPKYSGSHSHDEFVDWLSAFLNWLRGHYISGPATDPIRVTYLGLYIEGVANDWYLTEIDNPSRHYDPPLLFADCVCLMHKRFVRTATANDAAIKYNSVRYSAADGVEGLYYKLDTSAERMIERPNDYDFRRRLFNLLPRSLYEKLIDRNIIPEYASLDDIRENAKQIEENSHRRYEGVGDATALSSRAMLPNNTRPPRITDTSRGHRGNSSPAPAANAVPAVRTTIPATAPNQRASATRPPRTPRDTSTMTCYSCGKLGHISSEPKCEHYDTNRARLHAQREAEGNFEHDTSNSPDSHDFPDPNDNIEDSGTPEPAPSWGGSQYDSEPDMAHEVTAETDHFDDAPRMASMHIVRMAAMRAGLDASFPVIEEDSGDDEMPALESCSDSGCDEENTRSTPFPVDRTAPRTPLPVGHIIGVRYNIIDEHYDSDADSMGDDEDSSIDNHTTVSFAGRRLVIDLREGWERVPSRYIGDRGEILSSTTMRYIDDPAPIPEAPELASNHLTCLTMPRTFNIISHAVWIDTEARIMDLDDRQLNLYNRQLSLIVSCPICGGMCRPTAFQALHTVGTDIAPPLHMNLFSCSYSRPIRSPESSGHTSPTSDNDRYADPHGDYDEESMYAMRISYSSNVRRQPAPGEITRPRHNQETITAVVTINGHKALALFDSGSTTDSITPEFGFVSRTKQFKLDEQIVLQLGCVGSRSKISYGAVAPVSIFSVTEEMYFDVVNIDRYDAILGTPFLKKHGVCIDFKNRGVVIDGTLHKTFSMAEEMTFIAQKGEANHSYKRSVPRETAPIQPKRSAEASNPK